MMERFSNLLAEAAYRARRSWWSLTSCARASLPSAVLLVAALVVSCVPEEPEQRRHATADRPSVAVAQVEAAEWRWTGRRDALVASRITRELTAPFGGLIQDLTSPGANDVNVLLRIVSGLEQEHHRSAELRLAAEEELVARYAELRQEGVLLDQEWHAARRALDAASADYAAARARLEERTVRRPEGAVVTRWRVTDGTLVSTGDVLGWLAGPADLAVELLLPGIEVERWRDAALEVVCSAGRGVVEDTLLERLTEAPSRWRLELTLPGSHPCAREATRVEVHAIGAQMEYLWLVPPRAIAHDEEGSWLWRVDDEGRLERVEVVVAQALDGGHGVRGELTAGQSVVREQPRSFREGVAVRVGHQP